MRHDIQVLDRVKSTYASLRPSEQRVADCMENTAKMEMVLMHMNFLRRPPITA